MAKDPTALSGKIRIPQPAHPERRQQPLPWHRPKSPEEDPDAPSRLTAILASPSYRLAEQDLAFLERDETRGVRLQIEYLKPETLLQGHAIRDTVVVYGSTRIPEPAAARRSAEALRQALETDPGNTVLIRKLAVAERILAKSRYYEIAREFGRLVGSSCDNDGSRSKMVIMTGGGPGIMGREPRSLRCRRKIRWSEYQSATRAISQSLHYAGPVFAIPLFCLAQDASSAAGEGASRLSGWLWDDGRAVRSLDPGADPQNQASADRAGRRRVLASRLRRRVPGRRRCNRRGGSRAVLVR